MHQVIDGLFAAEVREIINECCSMLGVVSDSKLDDGILKDLINNTQSSKDVVPEVPPMPAAEVEVLSFFKTSS